MPLPQPQGDLLEHKIGGGCASLFGLPFFLAGIGVIVLTFVPREIRGGDEIPIFFGIPFGGIFAFVGSMFLFGRAGVVIDKSSGSVTKWWGLLVPMKSTTYKISQFEKVALSKEIRRSKNSSYTVYPVKLVGSADEVDISAERDFNKGRSDAEKLAKFLNLPIHDSSEGSERIRETEELDQTVKERFESGAISNEVPETPANLKSKIEYDGATLRVDSPPIGFHPVFLIPIVIVAFFEIFVLVGFVLPILRNMDNGSGAWIPLAFASVFCIFPILFLVGTILPRMLSKESITVDRHQLSVTKSWLLRKTQTIPTDQLEELHIGKSQPGQKNNVAQFLLKKLPIIARSDDQTITFASGLPVEEKEYILALSKAVIVS